MPNKHKVITDFHQLSGKLNSRRFTDKRNEYNSNIEGMVISVLSDRVLQNNPANSIYSFTMVNFGKGYSQANRYSKTATDCSAFTSSSIQNMIQEMRNYNRNSKDERFNENDLAKTSKAFQIPSTTTTQEYELARMYRSKGLKPEVASSRNVRNMFASVDKVGMVIYMDKDGNNRTTNDRHVWISTRDPKTNKIVWAESTATGNYGVIISSPEELKTRQAALDLGKRKFTLYDPFVGENRKLIDKMDEQQIEFNKQYIHEKNRMNSYQSVGIGNNKIEVNSAEFIKKMENTLINNDAIREINNTDEQQNKAIKFTLI